MFALRDSSWLFFFVQSSCCATFKKENCIISVLRQTVNCLVWNSSSNVFLAAIISDKNENVADFFFYFQQRAANGMKLISFLMRCEFKGKTVWKCSFVFYSPRAMENVIDLVCSFSFFFFYIFVFVFFFVLSPTKWPTENICVFFVISSNCVASASVSKIKHEDCKGRIQIEISHWNLVVVSSLCCFD